VGAPAWVAGWVDGRLLKARRSRGDGFNRPLDCARGYPHRVGWGLNRRGMRMRAGG